MCKLAVLIPCVCIHKPMSLLMLSPFSYNILSCNWTYWCTLPHRHSRLWYYADCDDKGRTVEYMGNISTLAQLKLLPTLVHISYGIFPQTFIALWAEIYPKYPKYINGILVFADLKLLSERPFSCLMNYRINTVILCAQFW